MVTLTVDLPEEKPGSALVKPTQANVDGEAIQNPQAPTEGPASTPALAASPSPSNPVVGFNPESEHPVSGLEPIRVETVAAPAFEVAIPVLSNAFMVFTKWGNSWSVAVPSGPIDEGDSTISDLAAIAEPFNCSPESGMLSVLDSVSHQHLLSLGMASSSNATLVVLSALGSLRHPFVRGVHVLFPQLLL